MATSIALKHSTSGVIKTGYYGFSWTTLFFGFFPALFRADFATFIGGFIIYVILGLISFGLLPLVASIAWSFMYNKYYTRRLLERGYVFADSEANSLLAKAALGVA